MIKNIKTIFKKLTLLFFIIVTSYFLAAYLLMLFPKKSQRDREQTRSIYILYNSMHSDIVFPINEVNLTHFPQFKKKKEGYIAFGWGDKETYLHTPTWSELKISTALKALFFNTPSLLHVSYYSDLSYYQTKKIKLSIKEQKRLLTNILNEINNKKTLYKGYSKNDFFYEAKGEYNLLHTCNTWTGDHLRYVGVSMSYWTPLSSNIIGSLE